MSKSARKYITGQTTVTVYNFSEVSPELAVISYIENDMRFDDLFNVHDPATMDTLLHVRAGKKVEAVLAPDRTTDKDSHPECLSAKIIS
jgi:hypothetical protein